MQAKGRASGELGGKREAFFARRGVVRGLVAGLLAVHAGLLAYSAYKHSPTWDEYGHLVAGISHWEFGRFDLYRVNPPLVRTVAAIPVFMAGVKTDWSGYSFRDGTRPERYIQAGFLTENGPRIFWLVTLARWACIPISLLGGWICYLWGRDLFGAAAGVVAAALWCFSPNVLGHGSLITPDIGAAAFGIAAHYAFWRYLSAPNVERAIASGALLSLAALSKTTWIVLPPIWVGFWLVWRRKGSRIQGINSAETIGNDLRAVSDTTRGTPHGADGKARRSFPTSGSEVPAKETPDAIRPRWRELLVIALVAWYVFNLGYLFEGTFTTIRDYRFVSRAFGGPLPTAAHNELEMWPRNPYRNTSLAHIPVPFPKNFVCGIDIQKWDFERRMWSYLRGEWRLGGWWYYYLYAMAVKMPLAVWGLAALMLAARVWRAVASARTARSDVDSRDSQQPTANAQRPFLLDEFFLLAPAIAVITLVSSQTGFNHHLRYVIPAFPFLFIWISQAARRSGELRVESREPEKNRFGSQLSTLASQLRPAVVIGLLAWFIAGSLYVYPHSLSYFNEAAGGPTNGWRHLADSNVDWGQDLLYLRSWYDTHPNSRPFALTNTSNQRVEVERFESSCDCTSITPASIQLGPGEVKELQLLLNLTSARSLEQEAEPFSVALAAISEGSFIGGPWTIRGEIRRFFTIAPAVVHLGEQDGSEEPKRKETVIVQCEEPIESVVLKSSTPSVEASVVEISPDHETAQLEIKLTDDVMVPPLGKDLSENVSIRALSHAGEEVATTTVRVTGFLPGIVTVTPRNISFGIVQLGASGRQRLAVESPTGASMRVQDLRVRGHGIEVERVGTGPGSLLEFEVSKAGVIPGNFADEIALNLRLDGYPSPIVLTVPVLGFAVDAGEFTDHDRGREKSVLVRRD